MRGPRETPRDHRGDGRGNGAEDQELQQLVKLRVAGAVERRIAEVIRKDDDAEEQDRQRRERACRTRSGAPRDRDDDRGRDPVPETDRRAQDEAVPGDIKLHRCRGEEHIRRWRLREYGQQWEGGRDERAVGGAEDGSKRRDKNCSPHGRLIIASLACEA